MVSDDAKAVVFVALDDASKAKAVALACRKRKIPVHVSNHPELSDFWLTASFRDHALQIAVSSGGNGPTLANRVRNHIAATLPPSVGKAMQRLSALRQRWALFWTKGSRGICALTFFLLITSLPLIIAYYHNSIRLRESDHIAGPEKTALLRHVSEEWPFDQIAQLSDHQIADLVDNGGKEGAALLRAKGRVQIIDTSANNLDSLTLAAYRALGNPDSLVVAEPTTAEEILSAVSGDLLVAKDKFAEIEPSVSGAIDAGRNVVFLVKETATIAELHAWIGSKYEVVSFAAPAAAAGAKAAPATVAATAEPKVAVAAAIVEEPLPPAGRGATEILSGNGAVAAAVSALNDQVFIHPLAPADYLGEQVTADKVNIYGRNVRPVVRSTKLGAGNGFFGALMAGSKASCLTSAQALPLMLPALYDIAGQSHNGAVIHATADAIDEDLVRRTDYTDAFEAASTGFAVLASHTVQEAYDMAVAAQVAAIRGKASILHVLDGSRVALEQTKVATIESSALAAEIKRAAARADAKAPLARTIDNVFADLERYFGRRYKPFEYSGDENAKVVFVALGGDAAVLEEAVAKSTLAAGVLKVRVYRPWNAEAFLSALPKSAEKVVVYESVQDGSAYLFKDVAATLARQRSAAQAVRLVGAGLTPVAGARVAKSLIAGSKATTLDLAEFTTGEQLVGEPSGEYVFWSNADVDVEHVTARIAKQAAEDHSTSRFVSHDALLPNAVAKAELRVAAPGELAATYPVSQADVTFVLADAVFASYEIVANAKKGSTLVLNTPLSDAELNDALPLATKQAIADKKIKVFAVDATLIAKNYTIFVGKWDAYLELILRGLFFQLRSDAEGAKARETIRQELLAVETNFTVLRTKISAIERAIKDIRTVNGLTLTSAAEQQPELKADVAGTICLDGPGLNFGEEEDDSAKISAHKSHVAAWNVIFRESLRVDGAIRPDIADARVATMTSNVRVTPESYDRNVFHMEIDISKTGLKYQMGDALNVHGLNEEKEVDEFLAAYGVSPRDVVTLRRRNASGKEVTDFVTARQLFTMHLDVFGKPGKKFYQDLANFAKSPEEKHTLRWLGSPEGEAEFKRRADLTYTYADLLLEFSSAKVSLDNLARIIPAIKPRAYSISSSSRMHPDSVHLLVVLVDWEGKDGKLRTGQCSSYLSRVRPGQPIIVSLTPSVMKLPADPNTPVIMSGLGTGMAPFRAFIQDRAVSKHAGENVGGMSLYFGSRYRAMEYLYGEELDAYHQDGLLTDLRLAFSRDQAKKIYIQHKISEDGDKLFDLLTRQKGHFYLCGPVSLFARDDDRCRMVFFDLCSSRFLQTWPVPDIKAALISAFVRGGFTAEEAEEYLEKMKEEERYVLEVY